MSDDRQLALAQQIAMGHESIRTTQHYYGRVTVEDVAAKIAGLAL